MPQAPIRSRVTVSDRHHVVFAVTQDRSRATRWVLVREGTVAWEPDGAGCRTSLDERYSQILSRCLPQWYDAVDRAAQRVLVAQGLDRALAATDVARLPSVAMVGMLLLDGRDGRPDDLSMSASRRLGGRLERLRRLVPVAVRHRVLR